MECCNNGMLGREQKTAGSSRLRLGPRRAGKEQGVKDRDRKSSAFAKATVSQGSREKSEKGPRRAKKDSKRGGRRKLNADRLSVRTQYSNSPSMNFALANAGFCLISYKALISARMPRQLSTDFKDSTGFGIRGTPEYGNDGIKSDTLRAVRRQPPGFTGICVNRRNLRTILFFGAAALREGTQAL